MSQSAIHPQRSSIDLPSFAAIASSLPFYTLVLIVLAVATPLHAQERPAVHKVPPVYPPIARQIGISGTVIVLATVDATGKVLKADSSSGNKLLAAAAIEAVKQWKFAPGDGTATFPVAINFEKE